LSLALDLNLDLDTSTSSKQRKYKAFVIVIILVPGLLVFCNTTEEGTDKTASQKPSPPAANPESQKTKERLI